MDVTDVKRGQLDVGLVKLTSRCQVYFGYGVPATGFFIKPLIVIMIRRINSIIILHLNQLAATDRSTGDTMAKIT